MNKNKFILVFFLIFFIIGSFSEENVYAEVTKEGANIIYEGKAGSNNAGGHGAELVKYTWEATFNGFVHIEAWGPQGVGNKGGNGGYASGDLEVKEGDILYIYLDTRPGRNASDIRLNGTRLKDRVLVAAGGGQEGKRRNSSIAQEGGDGGGKSGEDGTAGTYSDYGNYDDYVKDTGATQSRGGIGVTESRSGSFGYGGTDTDFAGQLNLTGAGGGGWYGGASGYGGTPGSRKIGFGGGGGSSYIGGVENGVTITGEGTSHTPKIIIHGANTSPIISLASPISNATYLNYQIPQISYNVYDTDNDTLAGYIYYKDEMDTWILLDEQTNLIHGDSYSTTLSASFWESVPFNTELDIKVVVSDIGNLVDEKKVTIKKINTAPTVTWNNPLNGSSFTTTNIPRFEFTVNDQEGDTLSATVQYYDDITATWKSIISRTTLASGESVSLTPTISFWKSFAFNKQISFRLQISDGIDTVTTSSRRIIKTNTAPSVAILKPINNERMYAGYLPMTWLVNDIDGDNINLKIWTDTPNIVNSGILFNGSIGNGSYDNNKLFKTFLPEGTHNIFFEFKDGHHTINFLRKIQIEKMIGLHIDENPTFYIPVFEKEKSDVYYKKINNMLDTNKYMFNILDLPENAQYMQNNIAGSQSVTGHTDFSNKSDYIYNTNSNFNINHISEWIISKATDVNSPVIKAFPVGSEIAIKNVEFEDQDTDYSVTIPYTKGKDRQFRFEHYPQFYENSDTEITENGVWLMDDTFNTFDGHSVQRNGQDIVLTVKKSGRYILSAKESDIATNYSGIDFSKESDVKEIELYAHRYPNAILNYTDNGNQTMNLTSSSYDMDFETRDDKGIAQEIWEYRFVGYDDTIIQDWTPITNLSSFAPNVLYKTDIRLTVKDYGARIDLVNDGELTDSKTITVDAIGRPPIADFAFKVGTTLTNSVFANDVVYKSNVNHETIQLDDSYIQWNDFYGTITTRNVSWSKNRTQLNNEVMTSASLSTRLNIRNRYNLFDNITKSINVRKIDITDYTIANEGLPRTVDFKVNLLSLIALENWGNLNVSITSTDLGLTNAQMTNTFSNNYSLNNISIPDHLATLSYSINIHSSRTNELIGKYDRTLLLNRPPSVTIDVSPDVLYVDDSATVTMKPLDPDDDVLTLRLEKRIDGGAWTTILTRNNVVSGSNQTFSLNNLVDGRYDLRVTVTDPYLASGTDATSFEVFKMNFSFYDIEGAWNHWRGQYDIFNKKLPNMPHRFMSYEKVFMTASVEGLPDYVEIRFSPELEAMTYVNSQGHTYRYVDHIGTTVSFPLTMDSNNNQDYVVDYTLPMAKSTIKDDYSTTRERSAYWIEFRAVKGDFEEIVRIDDIDLTGNTTNKMYIQPE